MLVTLNKAKKLSISIGTGYRQLTVNFTVFAVLRTAQTIIYRQQPDRMFGESLYGGGSLEHLPFGRDYMWVPLDDLWLYVDVVIYYDLISELDAIRRAYRDAVPLGEWCRRELWISISCFPTRSPGCI